jgi:hypothetical protein
MSLCGSVGAFARASLFKARLGASLVALTFTCVPAIAQERAAPLEPDVEAREARLCQQPPEPAFQGRSLWNPNLWAGGVVPYQFDANTTPSMQGAMRLAMDALEAAAYIHFVPRTSQGSYLHILDDNGNFTEGIGDRGGQQNVHIFNWNFRYIMVHELMHALGVRHEQSRPDRDQYINVNYANIQAGWGPQYDYQPGTPVGAFDFDSVMCYGPCSASVCCPAGSDCSCSGASCWTMTALPQYSSSQSLMGNRTHLSTGDIAGLVRQYGPAECPVFEVQPHDTTAQAGTTVTLTAFATGAGTPTYRWRRNGVPMTDGGRVVGAFASSLILSAIEVGDEGLYDCLATNSCGNTASTSINLAVACADWSLLSPAPSWSPRYLHSMAYDPIGDFFLVYGGLIGSTAQRGAFTLEYSGNSDSWRWRDNPNGLNAGYCRDGAMAWDGNRIILCGGYDDNGGGARTSSWAWNRTTRSWDQLPDGPNRRGHAAAQAPGNTVVVFGGKLPNGFIAPETWIWNGSTWSFGNYWTGPNPRSGHMLAYDPVRNVTVLFGGVNGSGTAETGTWEWTGTGWDRKTLPGDLEPPPRSGSVMWYDPVRARIVLFGGYQLDDTWEWDGIRWTEFVPATRPPYREGAAAATNSRTGETVLYGGLGQTGLLNDTWVRGGLSTSIARQPLNAAAEYGIYPYLNASMFVTVEPERRVVPEPMRWQYSNPDNAGSWTDLADGGLFIAGSHYADVSFSSTAFIRFDDISPTGPCRVEFRARIGQACAVVYSVPASLSLCVVDLDDGSSSGVCDGGVTIDDLLYYLEIFEQGSVAADVDDGSGSGVPDGGVTIDDLIYYLTRFEGGC